MSRQISSLVVVVAFSLLLPAAIVYASFVSALNDKPFGAVAKYVNSYRSGSQKDGELWFPVFELPTVLVRHERHVRIKRLDLETGIERETGLKTESNDDNWGRVIWVGNNLYFYTNLRAANYGSGVTTTVHQAVGSTFVELDNDDLKSRCVIGPPFEWQGRLSLVESTNDGRFRLLHWTEKKWIEGREIRLPATDSVWQDIPRSDQRLLVSSPGQQDGSRSASSKSLELDVIQQDGETLLFLQTHDSRFFACRRGFELVDQDSTVASALTPANAGNQASGWTTITSASAVSKEATINSSRDGLVFGLWPAGTAWDGQPQFVHCPSRGTCQSLTEEPDPATFQIRDAQTIVAASPSDVTTYIVRSNRWKAISIRRIEGNVVKAAHFVKAGTELSYLAHWGQLVAGLLIAWLLHATILMVGICGLIRIPDGLTRQSEFQTASIASPVRRLFAFVVDASLVLALLGLCCRLYCGDFTATITFPSSVQMAHDLNHHVENRLSYEIGATGIIRAILFQLAEIGNQLKSVIARNPEYLVVMPPCILTLFVLKWYFESRYAMTPGKWLLGIRTVRSNGRPARFASIAVRDVLIWCDIPCLLTPLPAAVSMMLSRL